MEEERRGGMEHLARRLDDAGLLRPEVTFDEAVEVLWVLCSFESFDLLFTGRGLAPQAAAALLISTAEGALCAEEGA
jgi:hypothetical protein